LPALTPPFSVEISFSSMGESLRSFYPKWFVDKFKRDRKAPLLAKTARSGAPQREFFILTNEAGSP
jgi:hypothetical protein